MDVTTRPIDSLLAEYGESHRNRFNKRVHWVCVPAIMFSLLGLLWLIRLPAAPWLNAGVVLVVLAMGYYLWLAPRLALGIAALAGSMLLAIALLAGTGSGTWQFHAAIFVVAWIAQFIGHHVEGKRPSFLRDVQFLLIGPLWVVAPLYHRLGWRY